MIKNVPLMANYRNSVSNVTRGMFPENSIIEDCFWRLLGPPSSVSLWRSGDSSSTMNSMISLCRVSGCCSRDWPNFENTLLRRARVGLLERKQLYLSFMGSTYAPMQEKPLTRPPWLRLKVLNRGVSSIKRLKENKYCNLWFPLFRKT